MSHVEKTPVPLTGGHVAWIDMRDLAAVTQHPWFAVRCKGRLYAARTGEGGRRICMHRVICEGKLVDHRDGDGLNNCRSNLRSATYSGNAANRDAKAGTATGLKGVYRARDGYIARIKSNGKPIYLGKFTSANHAYATAAAASLLVHGEFARFDVRAANAER